MKLVDCRVADRESSEDISQTCWPARYVYKDQRFTASTPVVDNVENELSESEAPMAVQGMSA